MEPSTTIGVALNGPGLIIGPLDSIISETNKLSGLCHSQAVIKSATLVVLIWLNAEYLDEPLSPP